MQKLSQAPASAFADVRFVLTDMDETLTHNGRLSARTYAALERLQAANIETIPVTAAPAGWCDQMARMWPIAGVISENGGLFMRRTRHHDVERHYWHDEAEQISLACRLSDAAKYVQARVPRARVADDQPFRLTSIAFVRPVIEDDARAVLAAFRDIGANTTVNNLWLLGWFGEYDKLAMTRRVMKRAYDVDIDQERDAFFYSGDSLNDASMFSFFKHTVGMDTVRQCLPELPVPPSWVSNGAGGDGFVEAVDKILASRE